MIFTSRTMPALPVMSALRLPKTTGIARVKGNGPKVIQTGHPGNLRRQNPSIPGQCPTQPARAIGCARSRPGLDSACLTLTTGKS